MNEEQAEGIYAEQQVQGTTADAGLKQTQQAQQQILLEEREKGIAEAQLEVNEIILELYQIIEGKKLRIGEYGQMEWGKADGTYLKIFSEYGVQKIMHIVKNYINKNTLLSNFNTEQINKVMLTVTTELNDLILLKYEDFFHVPSFEECKTILEERMKTKEDLRKYALELMGKEVNSDEVKREIKEEMERGIEHEIQKIREEERRRRLKEYGSITSYIEHQILTTLNRAYKGEERGSLRRHTSLSEVSTTGMPQTPKVGGGIFPWSKR